MHYCKGMLESVSVFLTPGCNEHEDLANLPSCCKNEAGQSCSTPTSDCCDFQVKVLLQDFDSLLPHFEKWDDGIQIANSIVHHSPQQVEINIQALPVSHSADSGPPIYIRFGSLIYYA